MADQPLEIPVTFNVELWFGESGSDEQGKCEIFNILHMTSLKITRKITTPEPTRSKIFGVK